ncbi:hypothetical protein [Spirosoma montaniterrae]|uniref:Uncharacterized protein n=1 Tax=Spirosoma montaniterrae TaxID=1178516 RepID=A0A1P9WYN6_9BACT|nr:hypothetical protein [Spirosoma montaniterrae]AQG80474.1 hypothetical protein AWR27_14770 [Spirosoma montaniterrae]
MNKVLQREFRVAFHRRSQPVWFRLVKYTVLTTLVYIFWHSTTFWGLFALAVVGGVGLHLFYRYKTNAWTRSYGRGLFRWDYDRVFGDNPNQ